MLRMLAAALAVLAVIGTAQAWTVEQINRHIDQTNFVVNGGCSGTLISVSERLILTNHHCLGNVVETIDREIVGPEGVIRKVKVRRYKDVPVQQHSTRDGARVSSVNYVSEVVVESQKVDLAVLRIKSAIPHTIAARLLPDNQPINRGEPVWIVGNPLGEDATLGRGIVSHSARNERVSWTGGEALPMIQHSAGSAGGNSGGALYNDNGELIGVPAASYRSNPHLGFAIPVGTVRAFLREHCLASVIDKDADDAACRKQRTRLAREAAAD